MIFYNFQHDAERIQRELKKLKLKVGVLKDSNDIAKWNNKELDILLAHPASAAYGLNLQERWKSCCLVWVKLELRAIQSGKCKTL